MGRFSSLASHSQDQGRKKSKNPGKFHAWPRSKFAWLGACILTGPGYSLIRFYATYNVSWDGMVSVQHDLFHCRLVPEHGLPIRLLTS
jgi:hypothetical protein